VVLAHGFHAGADDYLPLIEAVVDRGFSVLTYDVTGVYSSEGDSGIGMCQSLCDLDRVLTFAGKDERFASMPKFVLGHSWGGYAAASVLALHGEIKGAALIAPMNNGTTIMLEKGEEYAGKIAYTAKPIFAGYQRMLFGDYVNYNGVVGINSTKAPVLIAQGTLDTVITPDGQSITAHLDELTNPDVALYWGKDLQGSHTGIWHSVEAEEYKQHIADSIKKMEGELDRKLTDGERAEICSTVNHELYSEVNSELVDLIIQTFEKGLNII
jgi:pimeloyl-ACP methyl ester carboxylesterase